jgi:hypothetical protein
MYLVFFTGHIGRDEPFLLKYRGLKETKDKTQILLNLSALTFSQKERK